MSTKNQLLSWFLRKRLPDWVRTRDPIIRCLGGLINKGSMSGGALRSGGVLTYNLFFTDAVRA